MIELDAVILFAGVVSGATPIVFAALGETLTEKSGLINLSLDGAILLSAMAAFAVAYETGSVLAGYAAGALIGATIAAVVALLSVYLRQNQVAVGFVLTLTTKDLSYFLGNPYSRLHGPQVSPQPVILLSHMPFFGEILFNHNLPVYLSLILIGFCWWYIYRTSMGLKLRSVGEHPKAAYARGIDPRKLQSIYAVCGGILIGLAGATFSLLTKPGWGRPQGAEGTGWIALALVIFGGWNPVKAASGAYLFSFLQIIGIYFQEWAPSIPSQVFQVAPFPLMIFSLLIISLTQKKSILMWVENKRRMKFLLNFFSGMSPSALGKPYRPD